MFIKFVIGTIVREQLLILCFQIQPYCESKFKLYTIIYIKYLHGFLIVCISMSFIWVFIVFL